MKLRELLNEAYARTLQIQGIHISKAAASALASAFFEQPGVTAKWSTLGSGAVAVIAESAFDSLHLGCRVATIPVIAAGIPNYDDAITDITEQLVNTLDDNGFDLTICRLPVSEFKWIHALQSIGFKTFGNQLYFARNCLDTLLPKPTYALFRPARLRDADDLILLARNAFRHSHYYLDPRIKPSAAENLYAEWIRNDCQGRATISLVAEAHGKPIGYFAAINDKTLYLHTGRRRFHIDLVIVDPAHQGHGLATSLVQYGIRCAAQLGAEILTVSTQQENLPAIALYNRCGFETKEHYVTLHRWRPMSKHTPSDTSE
jgi:GNAT superfamily N-acetyltransferase